MAVTRALLRLVTLLCALAGSNAAMAQLQVNTAFTPAVIAPGANSVLRIELLNNTLTAASAVSLSANLPSSPAGLSIASASVLSNSCGGTVSAPSGGSAINLSGGAVSASVAGNPGSCVIELSVQASPPSPPATYSFTIPAANVTSSIGSASNSPTASLQILSANPITGAMTVSAPNIHGQGPSVRLRLQLNNSNGYALTGVGFSNTLPTQLEFASLPNVTSSCGGTVTIPSGGTSWSLSGGTIPAGSNCVIQADFVARNAATIPADGNASISLPIGAVTSTQTASNAAAINRSIRVQKAASITQVFSPSAITAGGSSTLTITLNNFNSTAITGFSFSDAMPTGITIAGGVSTTCGGTASFTATTISLSGANLAGAPSGIANASCTITMTVNAPSNGNFANAIPAGNLGGISYNSATASLLVSSVSVTKVFSPTSMPRTGVATLTITLTNRQIGTAATITSLTDQLTTMGTGFTVASSITPTSTCGGTLNAAAGGTSIILTGGTIPAATSSSAPGTCTVTVGVQVGVTAPTGNRTNTIAVNGLRTSLGNNLVSATARLSVTAPLTAAKTFSVATAPGGSVVRLTITLTRTANAGLMSNVSVSDTLPSGFTIAATPAAATTCASGTITAVPGATTVSLSGANLGTVLTSSSSCTVSVNVQTPTAIGTYTNTIPVGGATANTSVGSVATLTAASRVITIVDGVTISTSFNPISVVPGQISRLRIVVTNPASLAVTLTNVGLVDTLPTGLEIAPTPNAVLSATFGTCSGSLSAVSGGSSLTLSGGSFSSGSVCQMEVDVTPTAIGSLVNTIPAGSLTNTQGISNLAATSASLISSGNADISVTKSDSVTSIIAGNSSTYTIVITNTSTVLTVAGLPVVDDEPDDITFTAWTCSATSGSACADTTGSGAIDSTVSLAPSGIATFAITALVDPASERSAITNEVSVDPAAAGVFDPNTANNTASDTNTITTSADVSITKVSDTPTPAVGSTVNFTLTVSNAGPSVARNVVANDPLPTGYTLDDATPSQGSFVDPDWAIGDLAPGESVTIVIESTVNTGGAYTNTATVTATTSDPDTSNNTASVTPVTLNLKLDKSSEVLSDPVNGGTDPFAIPGAIVRYSIVLRNEGSASLDAGSVIITDILPDASAMKVTGAGGGITMTDGSPASGFSTSSVSIEWTDNAGGVGPYDYTPIPDMDGFDAAVTGFRILPSGAMSGGSPSSAPSVTYSYSVRLD